MSVVRLAVINGSGRRFSPPRRARKTGNVVLRREFDARTGTNTYVAALRIVPCQA